MQDLSFSTRDQTCAPCTASAELNHWTTREVPVLNPFLWPNNIPLYGQTILTISKYIHSLVQGHLNCLHLGSLWVSLVAQLVKNPPAIQEDCCMASVQLLSCPTLCHPMNRSLPGSSVCGILQTRIPEWVAIPFPEDFPDPEIEPGSLALQADSLQCEPSSKRKPLLCTRIWLIQGKLS